MRLAGKAALVLTGTLSIGTACASDPARAPTTTTGAATSAAESTAAASAGESADGSNADESADSGLPEPEFPCSAEDECRLVGDCCDCVAVHRDEPIPEPCAVECDRDMCTLWGLSETLCSHGCLVRLIECDPAMVTCADPPPTCAEGELPSLIERCWSGLCVPEHFCRP